MAEKLVSVDARNKLEDLSGIVIQPGENPYDVFIKACNDDPVCALNLYSMIYSHSTPFVLFLTYIPASLTL